MKILTKIMYIFATIIFAGIFSILLYYSENKLPLVFAIIILMLISRLFNKINVNNKIFCIIMFLAAFVIRLVVVLYMNVTPSSDFEVLYNAATNLTKGINVMNDSAYFNDWAYQSGFVLYQALALKIYDSIITLHLLDCFFTASICVLIYLIGKEINSKANIFPAILYSIYIYAITYTGVLTNQHIFTFLILISILMLLRETKYEKFKDIFIGILIGIANILRPEGIVILVSIIGYKVLKISDKKQVKSVIIGIAKLCIAYFAIVQIASFSVKITNVNKYGLTNNNPLWKFVCGSDYETGGGYSHRGLSIAYDKEKEKSFIIENYKSLDFKSLIRFKINKIRNFWTTGESYGWAFNNTWADGRYIDKYNKYDLSIYAFIFLLTIVSLVKGVKEKRNGKIVLALILLVNFYVYLLIEVQVRYSYTVKIIMFILAADGIVQIGEMGNILKNKVIDKINKITKSKKCLYLKSINENHKNLE